MFGMGLASGLFRPYIEHKMAVEREDADLTIVMAACYGMAGPDAWNYAREARACVGSSAAREAALAGYPFMLPCRGAK